MVARILGQPELSTGQPDKTSEVDKPIDLSDPQKALQTISAVLPQLRNSYGQRHELKTQLISSLADVATFFIKINKYKEAIALLKEADQYVGEEFWHVYGVFIRINIAYCYFALRDSAQAKKYALEAVAMNKLRFHWDVNLFKMIFPQSRKILN
uniref:Uncharacterized protein n=1 Tax=Ditylenchus dipsaci TaxID=166011 RepID=A0A915D9J7_9BILA